MTSLIERIESAEGLDNALDVLIEVALFNPDSDWVGCRANNAGTKVIYTLRDGTERTYWAEEWTADRAGAAAALRARGEPA